MSFVVVLVGDGCSVRRHSEGLHPRSGHRSDAVTTEAAQGTASRRCRSTRSRSPRSSRRPERRSAGVDASAAPPPRLGGPNLGQLVVHLKPRAERKQLVDEIIEDCGRSWRTFPGMQVYLQNPPMIRIGGQVSKSLYQFSMQSPDKTGTLRSSREARSKSWRSIPACETSRATCRSRARRSTSHRSRQGRGPRRQREADRERALRRLRPALGLDHLLASTSTRCCSSCAGVSAGSARAVAALLQAAGRAA